MSTRSLTLAGALLVIAACTKGAEKPAAAPAPAPKGVAVTPSKPLVADLQKPAASKKVKHKSGIGEGKLAIALAETPGGSTIWVERYDMEGTGDVEPTELAVNFTTHVGYAYGQAAVRCKDGTMVHGPQIMGVYLEGNVFKQPRGSGWYATELQTGQCGMTEPTVWGSRFDARGVIYAEGVAMIYPKTGDLLLVTVADIKPKP